MAQDRPLPSEPSARPESVRVVPRPVRSFPHLPARSAQRSREIAIGPYAASAAHRRRRCCETCADRSEAAERSGYRNRRAGACPDSERSDRTNPAPSRADAPSSRSGYGLQAVAPVRQEWDIRRTSINVRPDQTAIVPKWRKGAFVDTSRERQVHPPASRSCRNPLPAANRSHPAASDRRPRQTRRPIISPGKMPADHILGYRQKLTVPAGSAFHARLFADPPNPLLTASRRVSRLPRTAAFEATRIDIFPAPKE